MSKSPSTKALYQSCFDLDEAERRYLAQPGATLPEARRLRKLWLALAPEDRMMRTAMAYLYGHDQPYLKDADKALIVTPFGGAYGLAGYVVAVNGTPPKGTIIVQTMGSALDLIPHRSLTVLALVRGGVRRLDRGAGVGSVTGRLFAIVNEWVGYRLRTHPEDANMERHPRESDNAPALAEPARPAPRRRRPPTPPGSA